MLHQDRLADVLGSADARLAARRALPAGMWHYVDGGAEDERTMHRNTEAFRELVFHPRQGLWHPSPQTATTLFGSPLSMPVLTAPCGGLRQVHPEGDVGVARAATAAGTIHVPSSASGHALEEVASASSGPKWFQLYRFWSREGMEALLARVAAAGYEALVVTIDSPVSGYRERDIRYGFRSSRIDARVALKMAPQLVRRPAWLWRYWQDGRPFGLANTVAQGDGRALPMTAMAAVGPSSLTASWEDLEWIRGNWSGPLLVKGVLTPEDARRAIASGSEAIIVSNHGGRQLESAPATIDVLPSIVAAAGEDAIVLLDSGIRRGGDVVKALALGAKAVLVGRPYVWGLALAGERGVTHMLELLRTELVRTMQLLGCGSIHDLDRSWLQT